MAFINRDLAGKVPGAAHIANLQNEAGFNAILLEFLAAQGWFLNA